MRAWPSPVRAFTAAAGAAGERIGRFVLPGMPNLHSHAFQRAMAGLAERADAGERQLLDLARDDVRLRRPHRSGRAARDRRAALRRDAQGRLHAGLRIPLPASPARRQAVCRSGGDVAGADRGGARGRHRPHAAAGAVHDRRLRRPRRCPSGSAASATTSMAICACSNACADCRNADACASASRCIRCARCPKTAMRAVLASRVSRRDADPHPHRRADRRSAGLPRAAQRAPGRMAARSCAASMRAGASCTRRT